MLVTAGSYGTTKFDKGLATYWIYLLQSGIYDYVITKPSKFITFAVPSKFVKSQLKQNVSDQPLASSTYAVT